MTRPRAPHPPADTTPNAAPDDASDRSADATAQRPPDAGPGRDVTAGATRKTFALVDRIEGAWAVLIPQGPDPVAPGAGGRGTAAQPRDEAPPFDLPRSLLPAGTREGDAVWLRLSLDPPRRRQAEARTERLLTRLTADDDGGDLSL